MLGRLPRALMLAGLPRALMLAVCRAL